MRDRAPVGRSSATTRPRQPAWALAAVLSLGAASTSGPHTRTTIAALVLVLAMGVAAAVVHRRMARRRRSREAAAWNDAVRIAELTRAGVVGELDGWIDRELSTPIAALLNNLGAARRLLASGDRGTLPDVLAAIDEARSEGERAALAIRRMPQLLGANACRREPLDLNEIAREAIRLVGRHADASGVALRATLDEHLPSTRGDAAQILQVALSLILRALDNASTSSRRRAVLVRTALRDDGLELAVSDSGAGISEIDRAHLFAPFSPMRSGGLGIGITMARSIVEAHGGRIAAERPQSGALFRVVLPACAAPTGS